jgi:hypothetical protein
MDANEMWVLYKPDFSEPIEDVLEQGYEQDEALDISLDPEFNYNGMMLISLVDYIRFRTDFFFDRGMKEGIRRTEGAESKINAVDYLNAIAEARKQGWNEGYADAVLVYDKPHGGIPTDFDRNFGM